MGIYKYININRAASRNARSWAWDTPPGLGPDKAPRPSPHNAQGHGNSLTNENERKSSGPTIRGGSSRRARCARNGPKSRIRRTSRPAERPLDAGVDTGSPWSRTARPSAVFGLIGPGGRRSIHGAATCSARGRKAPRTFPRVTRPRLVSRVGLVFHVFSRAPKTKRGTERTKRNANRPQGARARGIAAVPPKSPRLALRALRTAPRPSPSRKALKTEICGGCVQNVKRRRQCRGSS